MTEQRKNDKSTPTALIHALNQFGVGFAVIKNLYGQPSLPLRDIRRASDTLTYAKSFAENSHRSLSSDQSNSIYRAINDILGAVGKRQSRDLQLSGHNIKFTFINRAFSKVFKPKNISPLFEALETESSYRDLFDSQMMN